MEVLINFVWPFGSLLLFILYGLIGIGLTRRIFTRSGYLAITLAPSMGVAILVVSSFVLSKLGFPLREVGLSLVLALLLISYSLLREAKFLNYRRAHKIYTATFVSSLTYVWPFFRFGSQWISYANDDMTNYVLGSKRLFSNGFESVPNPKILTGGFDYSSAYYWFYVKQQTRSGSELFISLISFFNGGNQLKLYMLILFSLQLTLVISMLSLLFEFSRKKLIVACVLAVSSIAPLFSVSFIFQLVGQIGGQAIGIGLICALYALLKKPRQKVLSILALTLYFVGLLIWYPEIIPFVAVSVMFFLILLIFRKQLKIRRIIFLFLITQAVSILILQEYYLGAWRFLIRQLTGAQVVSSSDNTELFPYFLVPRGLSVLLGWTPMSVQQTATAENFFIILSVFSLSCIP
jgi:hypothetical protein